MSSFSRHWNVGSEQEEDRLEDIWNRTLSSPSVPIGIVNPEIGIVKRAFVRSIESWRR